MVLTASFGFDAQIANLLIDCRNVIRNGSDMHVPTELVTGLADDRPFADSNEDPLSNEANYGIEVTSGECGDCPSNHLRD
jgi:hypothetical protein